MDEPVKRALLLAARIYAIGGAVLLLLYLPFSVYRSGEARMSPVQLGRLPRRDASTGGLIRSENRRAVISSVSINGGPWVPAGGVTVARELSYLPVGTPVSFRESSDGTVGKVINGRVDARKRSPEDIVAFLLFTLIGATFGASGAAMAIAGANRLSLLAAAMLVGSGQILVGNLLVEPNASLIAQAAWRNGVVVLWAAFPRHLAFFWLVSFLSVFPGDLWSTRVSRISRHMFGTLAVVYVVIATVGQFPGTFERLPVGWQAVYMTGHRWLIMTIFVLGSLSILWVLLLQVRLYRRHSAAGDVRRRASIVGAAFVIGVGPALVLALFQAASIVIRGKFAVSSLVMSFSYVPSLLIPPALAYAVLAPRVESVGILVRKAALFGFAEKTVRVVSLLPLAGLAFYLWMHRQSRLDELIAAHPLPLVAAVGASILGLTTADRARTAVERLFFRRKIATALILRDLAEKAREARDVAKLGSLLTTETDKALGLESIALFVRDEGSDSYSCDGRDLPGLEGASVVVEAASRARGPLRVDLDDPGSPLHGLPELDRHWIQATGARLLVPLTGSDDHLLALLVLGDKRSELPFDREDEQLLAAVAASGALALENQILRSSGSSGGDRASRDRTADYSPAAPDMDAGLFCRTCARVFAPGSGALCPDDESRLEPAAVPHLLAGKYRFEKRIGVGGMGVVYRARDVSLARDVAIKILPRVSHQAVRRLRREARAAARLIHPNLGLIFAAETWRGTPMLVLEFLDGGTLEDRIECGPIPASDVVDWGIRLAGALEAAHAQAILHRDIKPSNIGFTTRGVPKLLDFGLVRLLDDPESTATDEARSGLPALLDPLDSAASGTFDLTASGRVVGTAAYLSPEAVQGQLPAPGFDVWGLTLTLYEALTGDNPFAVAPIERAFNLILTVPVPDPRLVRPDCPEAVAAFFAKALSKSSHERPLTARELRERLEALRP